MAKEKSQKLKATSSKEAIIPSDAPTAAKIRRVNTVQLPIPELPQKSGNLLVCGQNDVGQLGMNPDDVMEKTRPALVAEVADVVDVKAGGMHSLCLTKSGEIWSFGCNDEGALGRDTEEEGSENKPKKIDLPGRAVRISAGDSHSACLLEDGRVFAWGSFRDSHGSMGLTAEGNKKAPIHVIPEILAADVVSGNDHLVILSKNGLVFTLGCAEQGQLGRVTARTLTGESRSGKKTLLSPAYIPKKNGKFIANAIWATPFCTFLREQGTDRIYGFGLNNFNQLGVAKSGKEFEHFPVLSKFTNVRRIVGGQHHTIVLTNDHKVHAIGKKDYGRLGLGVVENDIEELTLISSLRKHDIVDVSCGDCSTFAITKDGQLYVWGMGTNSQLGTGDDDDVQEPKLLATAQVKEKNILAVNSGGQHSLFVVEVPESTAKPVKAPATKAVKSTTESQSTVTKTNSETAPKENGTLVKTSSRTTKKKPTETPVIMESDSTTDVNGNSEKDEKMEIDGPVAKRARKRKV